VNPAFLEFTSRTLLRLSAIVLLVAAAPVSRSTAQPAEEFPEADANLVIEEYACYGPA
jgi:hypothetical protein